MLPDLLSVSCIFFFCFSSIVHFDSFCIHIHIQLCFICITHRYMSHSSCFSKFQPWFQPILLLPMRLCSTYCSSASRCRVLHVQIPLPSISFLYTIQPQTKLHLNVCPLMWKRVNISQQLMPHLSFEASSQLAAREVQSTLNVKCHLQSDANYHENQEFNAHHAQSSFPKWNDSFQHKLDL